MALFALGIASVFFIPADASAATTCTFATTTTRMELNGDCTTDSTIFVPQGVTLDGNSHTITAVDPALGHFLGAVVKNSGTTTNVEYLKITTSNLTDICDAGDDRLRGIMFDGSSGEIRNNTVTELNQGNSGCQEGNAIEVRNAPFDGTHPATKTVNIHDNTVTRYQKTGILVNGDVSAQVVHNKVRGLGSVNFIAQNGIQMGFGAFGTIYGNDVSSQKYTLLSAASSGILVFSGGNNIVMKENDVELSDIGIWLAGASFADVRGNDVDHSTFDGIALDDQGGPVTNNKIINNYSLYNDTGLGAYGASNNAIENNKLKFNQTVGLFSGFGATGNNFEENMVNQNVKDGIIIQGDNNILERNNGLNNGGTGITVDGNGNRVLRNKARWNAVIDIDNTGSNSYQYNICDTSTGAPVDCGSAPAPVAPLRLAAPLQAAATGDSPFTAQPFIQ